MGAGQKVGGVGSGVSGSSVAWRLGESEMKLRQGSGVVTEKAQNAVDPNPLARTGASSPREETMVQRLKHYDADVLTKVRERVVVSNGRFGLTCILAVCRVCWYRDTRLRSYPAPV